jgi:hypothetical protein
MSQAQENAIFRLCDLPEEYSVYLSTDANKWGSVWALEYIWNMSCVQPDTVIGGNTYSLQKGHRVVSKCACIGDSD